jgi:hypothetical protein
MSQKDVLKHRKMYVDDFIGEIIVSSQNELVECLGRRPKFNSNYFILTFEESGFPQLSIFIKDDKCVIYFLDIGKSFLSLNNRLEEGTTMFYENIGGAEVELPNKSVISICKMQDVSIEFFKQQQRPMSIDWLEI